MTGSIRIFEKFNFTPKSSTLAFLKVKLPNMTDWHNCSNPVFNGVHVFWVSRDLSMGTFLIIEWGDILVVAFKL